MLALLIKKRFLFDVMDEKAKIVKAKSYFENGNRLKADFKEADYNLKLLYSKRG